MNSGNTAVTIVNSSGLPCAIFVILTSGRPSTSSFSPTIISGYAFPIAISAISSSNIASPARARRTFSGTWPFLKPGNSTSFPMCFTASVRVASKSTALSVTFISTREPGSFLILTSCFLVCCSMFLSLNSCLIMPYICTALLASHIATQSHSQVRNCVYEWAHSSVFDSFLQGV